MKTALPYGTFMAITGILMIFFDDTIKENYILLFN